MKKKLSRRESVKKIGWGVFTASTMMILLNDPAKAQQPFSPPDGGGPPWGGEPGPPFDPGNPPGGRPFGGGFEEF